MAEAKPPVKCLTEFDAFVKAVAEWLKKNKELTEEKPTEEKLMEVIESYKEAAEKGKIFAACEFKE